MSYVIVDNLEGTILAKWTKKNEPEWEWDQYCDHNFLIKEECLEFATKKEAEKILIKVKEYMLDGVLLYKEDVEYLQIVEVKPKALIEII